MIAFCHAESFGPAVNARSSPRSPTSRPPARRDRSPPTSRGPAWGPRGRSVAGAGYFPANPNVPRPVFRNRASVPFLPISRMIAAYNVAAGVWPLGEVQYPLADIASISAGAVSGVPASASTRAAASSGAGLLVLDRLGLRLRGLRRLGRLRGLRFGRLLRLGRHVASPVRGFGPRRGCCAAWPRTVSYLGSGTTSSHLCQEFLRFPPGLLFAPVAPAVRRNGAAEYRDAL